MSTILKALRRLEEEKAARHARGLRDEVVSPPRAPAPGGAAPPGARVRLVAPVLGGAAAALAVAGGLAFAFWPSGDTPTPTGVASGAPSPGLPGAPAPAPPAVAAAPHADLPAPAPGAAAAPAAAAAPEPAPLGSPAPSLPAYVPSPTVAVAPTRPRVAPRRPAAPPGSDAALEGLPGRTVDVRRADESWLDEPPPRAEERVAVVERSGGPDVVVSRLVWHPAAERRVAFVDPAGGGARREVREGDYVEDYVVRRIEPSLVVFARDGVEVRRRIGQGP